VCSTDRLDVDLSIGVWMSSIGSTVNFLFHFYENLCFSKIVKISLSDEKLKKDIFAHFYTRQSIRSLIEYASNARLWTSLELKYTKKFKFN